MRRVKRRIFSGSVCEQIVYYASEHFTRAADAKPRLRFRDDEERAQHKAGISRRNHSRRFNAAFSTTSLYSTLTFDDEHEVHTFPEAKRIRDNFIRRLQYAFPDAVIFAYLGRGESTSRIHMHMVSEGVPEELIKKQWREGKIRRIERLREHNYYQLPGKGLVDCGQDYSGLANYLFNHWTPEQGGHRYKATRNAKAYDREDAEEVKREYSEAKPPKAPKGYFLTECTCTSYGYLYFKYVLTPPPRRRKSSLVNV